VHVLLLSCIDQLHALNPVCATDHARGRCVLRRVSISMKHARNDKESERVKAVTLEVSTSAT